MRIVRLPKKEFRKRFGPHYLGRHVIEEGEDVIYVPYGASTKTVMHEIAHAKLGHKPEDLVSYNEAVEREVRADEWVYERLGKEPTWEEIFADLSRYVDELLDKGYSVNQIFVWLKGKLEDLGYIFERQDRSDLWWFIRNKWEAKRKERG